MACKLIVLCDGTFNDSSSHTNVFKLKNALSRPGQRVYYDEGVGITEEGTTKGTFGRLLDQLAGGAFGSGVSGNIQQAYRWVCDNYEDGDELYFFGFSRGAFTARSVVGMIRKIGLIRGDLDHKTLQRAYDRYRDEHHPNCMTTEAFRISHNTRRVEDLSLRFLGVWDTVGALGVPVVGPRSLIARRRWGFHDLWLSSHVQTARQALAVDERRAAFLPAPWCAEEDDEKRDVEQRWFAGCHSDVGGNNGAIAFRWILEEAQKTGLSFDFAFGDTVLPHQVLHESLSGTYKTFVGAARRPVRELAGNRDSSRFMNETIDPTAKDLNLETDPEKPARPAGPRSNLVRQGKIRGADLGWGLFVGYYAGQYRSLCRQAPVCSCEKLPSQPRVESQPAPGAQPEEAPVAAAGT